jgi:heme oxygenase
LPRALLGPLLIAAGSQLGAAYLDRALRWGTLAGIALALYHAWRQNRWEELERRRLLQEAARTPLPSRRRADWWPKDW